MVQIPRINNQATANRKEASILQQIGITLFLDALEQRKEAYFLDVDNGTNQAGALAFRLMNGANDTVNYFLGQPLAPTPTVQDIIDNPNAHFRRMMIGTNLDVRRAVAEAPDQETAIKSGLQARRTQGDALAQVIGNAINADKDVRRAFDSYIIQAREFAIDAVRNITEAATSGQDENIARLINGLSEFVIDAAFARPRRSGDGKRVSKEIHEYNYLSQEKIKAYGFEQFGVIQEEGFTHLEVALLLLKLNFNRGDFGTGPGLKPGKDAIAPAFENIESDGAFNPTDNELDPTNFSYGNFIDSYHMRRLLAELKKIVQSTRLDNVSDFLSNTGMNRPSFINNLLHRLSPAGFISLAANEFIINHRGNPTRPVRKFVDSTEVVQAGFPDGFDGNVDEGPLLTFVAGQQRGPAF